MNRCLAALAVLAIGLVLAMAFAVSGFEGAKADRTQSILAPVDSDVPRETDRGVPDTVTPPTDWINVPVGADLQKLIDQNPIGSKFLLSSGTHRGVRVIPRNSQTFKGEDGAVLSGAQELRTENFNGENGAWWIGGQNQQGLIHGETLEGAGRDRYSEELFVDGNRRLRHVSSVEALDDDSWYFDYDTDKIWLGADPQTFESIETSVLPFAFAGTGVKNVRIENLIVEKYASPYQYGAIGGDPAHRYTYDWHIEGVVSRYNHGAGILLGPGMVVVSSRFHHNGQLGMGGNGLHPVEAGGTGYSAPTVVRSTEIDHNLQLGFEWDHEGGGTKFSLMEQGMLFEQNWIHDNNGPGIWWDVRDRNTLIKGNLVEDNEQMGIFYEISYGESVIEGNVVRRNGTDTGRSGVVISLSEGVNVKNNVVVDNGGGILVLHDEDRAVSDSEPGAPLLTENIIIADNIISPGLRNGLLLTGPRETVFEEVEYRDNSYRGEMDGRPFLWQGRELTISEWQSVHPTDGGHTELAGDEVSEAGLEEVLALAGEVGPGGAGR